MTREQRFVRQAEELAGHTEPPADFVPFMHYSPTYRDLSEAQSRWYFYWRGEVRAGRYPRTDLSYIFLYIYELINGIGWQKPEQGYTLLLAIWLAYRDRFPRLDNYLSDWMADFVLIHRLEVSVPEALLPTPGSRRRDLLERELWRRLRAEPPDLSFNLAMYLSDYDIRRSRFYLGEGGLLLEKYIPKTIALVDAYLQKQYGVRLIEMFAPRPVAAREASERLLFGNAVYDSSLYGRTLAETTPAVSLHEPLRTFITQLVRLTENKLRETVGFKTRLRGIELEPEIEILVARFLERETKGEWGRRAGGPRPISGKGDDEQDAGGIRAGMPIAINPERLAQLRRDSRQVQEMLTLGLERSGEEEHPAPGREDIKPAPSGGEKAGRERVDPAGSSRETGEEPTERQENQTPVVWDTAGLDDRWRELAGRLSPAQIEALYALKQGTAEPALSRIAARTGTLSELLLDEINAAAMETIGDLLIDGKALTEEYLPMLERLSR